MLSAGKIKTDRRQAAGNCGMTGSYRDSGACSGLVKLKRQVVATRSTHFLAAKTLASHIVISHSALRGGSSAIRKKLLGFTLSARQAYAPASYLASFLTMFSQ